MVSEWVMEGEVEVVLGKVGDVVDVMVKMEVEVVEVVVVVDPSLPGEQGQSEAAPSPTCQPGSGEAAGAQQFGGIRPGGDTATITAPSPAQ